MNDRFKAKVFWSTRWPCKSPGSPTNILVTLQFACFGSTSCPCSKKGDVVPPRSMRFAFESLCVLLFECTDGCPSLSARPSLSQPPRLQASKDLHQALVKLYLSVSLYLYIYTYRPPNSMPHHLININWRLHHLLTSAANLFAFCRVSPGLKNRKTLWFFSPRFSRHYFVQSPDCLGHHTRGSFFKNSLT